MPLRSFIEVSPDSHFPLENLPFGIFQPRQGNPRVGVAIGDLILDLSALELGHFRSPEFQNQKVFSQDSLNSFLALGRSAWRKTRDTLQHLLSADTPTLRDDARLRENVFHVQKDVAMKLPVRIYGVVLSFMVMLAMHTMLGKNKRAAVWMMTGAILFVASDSLLAFNKFFSAFNYSGLIVMLTYGLAQLFITEGAVRYIDAEKSK